MKKNLMLILFLAAVTGLSAGGSQGSIIYVNAASTGGIQNGRSWDKAYSDLNRALAAADKGDEIRVAAGIYRPSDSDRKASFHMKSGVSLYGGFAGNEKNRTERDWKNNLTILSGEINDPSTVEDNSMTVVMAADGVLDGFTITGGYGMGGPDLKSAGSDA